MMVARIPRSRSLCNSGVSTLCCGKVIGMVNSIDRAEKNCTRVERGIKRTTYPLISWAQHQTPIVADQRSREAADGHRASSDLRLWAHAPDLGGRSDLVAWPDRRGRGRGKKKREGEERKVDRNTRGR